MKTERLPKILLTGFVAALLVYIIVFASLQSCRTTKGPWRVVFMSDNSGAPGILVTHPKLNISERILFTDQKIAQSNLVREIIFADPTQTNVPFGEVVFQDLTFLPGTVTLNLFGHEIEMIPRALTVDKQEHAWKKGDVISVSGKGKFKPLPKK